MFHWGRCAVRLSAACFPAWSGSPQNCILYTSELCLKAICPCELVASDEGNATGGLVGTQLMPASV